MRSPVLENGFVVVITLALLGLVCLPLLAIAAGALGLGDWLGLSGDPADPEAYRYLLEHYGRWLAYSGGLAATVVALNLLLAVPAAYSFVRHPFPGSRLLEELVLLPLSLPGIALAVGLLAAYPAQRGRSLVLAGHLLYTLPLMLRIVTGALRSQDLHPAEQAARTLGAGFWRRFFTVVLPGLRHAMVLGSLLVFAVSWGELNVSFLLNNGPVQTFPMALYNTYANESFARSCAATVLFLAGVIPVVLAIQWLGGARAADVEQGV